jgi:hypothetical protein
MKENDKKGSTDKNNYEKKTFIGTANLGINYGPKYNSKIFPKDQIHKLLKQISEDPRIYIDTASSYTNAESLIGEFGCNILSNKITTKILINNQSTNRTVNDSIKESLRKVRQENFYSVLIHNSEAIDFGRLQDVISGLEESKAIGLTSFIGVSTYEAKSIIDLNKHSESFTHFQINENAIAQVNYNNKKLIEISKKNISIYVRSIFLQGLLLMSANEVPHFFAPVSNIFKNFENFCNLMSISKFKCCIEYVKSLNWSSGIVAGISNIDEYEKLISEIYSPQKNIEIPFFAMNQFYSDPRNWR